MLKVKVELDEYRNGYQYEERNDLHLCNTWSDDYSPIDVMKQEFQEICDVDGCGKLLQSNENALEENSDPNSLKMEKDGVANKTNDHDVSGLEEEKEMENKICRCHMWKYRKRYTSNKNGKVKSGRFLRSNSLSHYNTNLQKQLSVHLNSVHLSLENQKCSLCDFRTTHKAYLKRHIKAIHMQVKYPGDNIWCRVYDSPGSENKLTRMSNSIRHIHLRPKKQNCKYCNYSTNIRDLFRIHAQFAHLNGNITKLTVNELVPKVET